MKGRMGKSESYFLLSVVIRSRYTRAKKIIQGTKSSEATEEQGFIAFEVRLSPRKVKNPF